MINFYIDIMKNISQVKQNSKITKKLILIADDDKFYTNTYKKKILKEGYKVSVVHNGKDLLKALKKQKPDLLLIDWLIPKISSHQVLKKIKKDKNQNNIKVIVLVNLDNEDDIKKAKEIKPDGLIIKTNITTEQMIDKIKELF